MKRRLLILDCSKTKDTSPGFLPAIDRYKGRLFHVLHHFLDEYPQQVALLDVYILSPKYGLIFQDCPIEDYCQDMDEARAIELQPQVNEVVLNLELNEYASIGYALSKRYSVAFEGLPKDWIPAGVEYTKINLRWDRDRRELKEWLCRVR